MTSGLWLRSLWNRPYIYIYPLLVKALRSSGDGSAAVEPEIAVSPRYAMTERTRHARSEVDMTTDLGHHCPEGAQLMIPRQILNGEHVCSVRSARFLERYERLHSLTQCWLLLLALWGAPTHSGGVLSAWVAHVQLKECCKPLHSVHSGCVCTHSELTR